MADQKSDGPVKVGHVQRESFHHVQGSIVMGGGVNIPMPSGAGKPVSSPESNGRPVGSGAPKDNGKK